MSTSSIDQWMQRYLDAWASDDPDHVAALFTDDAVYYTEPYAAPWEGREQIVREWIEHGDSAREWSFTYETLLEHGDLAIVQGHTHYGEITGPDAQPAADYENLWVVRLAPDGRAREFTEWWMRTRKVEASPSVAEESASE